MEITRKTKLKEAMKSASGHDIIARLLYSLGLDESLITKTPLGNLTVGSLKKLILGVLTNSSIFKLFNTSSLGSSFLSPFSSYFYSNYEINF